MAAGREAGPVWSRVLSDSILIPAKASRPSELNFQAGWVREKNPVTTEVPAPVAKGACASLPEPSQYVGVDEVVEAMKTGDKLIIDARPERRFTGEYEPLDPVAGHVPGAINWDLEDNLDIDGTFLPPEALREMAEFAFRVNESTENIGARRLHTIMERLLDEISFEGPDLKKKTARIDGAYVKKQLAEIVKDQDLSRYIL